MLPLPIHFFAAVEHPGVAVAPCGGLQRDRVGAVVGLGEGECADLVQPRHAREPALLLVLGAAVGDRAHGESGLDADEGADAAVSAGELHGDQPGGQRVHGRAAVALQPVTDEACRAELLDDGPGELGPLPVVVDGGQDDVVDELSGPGQIAELVGGELVAQEEVVGGQRIADAGCQVLGHGVFSSSGTGPLAAGGSSCRNSSITGTSSPGSRGELEVPAAVDVQPCVRDQGGEQPPVDRRDEGVVVAGEYQRRLAQGGQERDARPARARQQLVVVAAAGPDAAVGVQEPTSRAEGRCVRCRRRSRPRSRRRWSRSRWRRGVAIRASTLG